MLNSDPEIKVIDTAKDGSEAFKKIPKIKPDCITLDLVMPGWDGLTTLKHIMDEYPTPVVMLSAHSKKDADITIKCLNAGAVGFVLKPSGELSLDIERIKDRLLKEVKAASKVNVPRLKSLITKKPRKPRRKLIAVNKIIVIGASTGGLKTLEVILSFLPANFSPSVIVAQHMPTRFFTQSLAKHLNEISQLEVKVAENNEIIQAGKVYLAPGGFQMTLKPRDMRYELRTPNYELRTPNSELRTPNSELRTTNVVICLNEAEPDSLTPSIDITMESAAKIYEENAIGVILSGMGYDGREGMRAIKKSGGKTITQDESSLIFGMPKAVIEAGYADKVLPMSGIARAIIEISDKE